MHVEGSHVVPVLLTGQEVELLRDHLPVQADNHPLGQVAVRGWRRQEVEEAGGEGGKRWNIYDGVA